LPGRVADKLIVIFSSDRRWAKSTLVLVPLFGVHYTGFLGMSYITGVHPGVEIAWLFCDQLFASFQVRHIFYPGATQLIVGVYFTVLYRTLASSHTRLLDHIQRRTTVGRTPLNE
jgi:hypothetical protein